LAAFDQKTRPAKVTPFDGAVERALAAFDQKTRPAKVTPLTALSNAEKQDLVAFLQPL
jgi:hypothetical protein